MLYGIDNTNSIGDVRQRFDMSHFMEFTSGWYDSMNSEFIEWIIRASPDGWYTVREPSGRPDLVSYNIYGDTQYWWILLMYNEIICPWELETGMEIKFISKNRMLDRWTELKISGDPNIGN